jgi:hypothetical protein
MRPFNLIRFFRTATRSMEWRVAVVACSRNTRRVQMGKPQHLGEFLRTITGEVANRDFVG